jgi:hypothetical protein
MGLVRPRDGLASTLRPGFLRGRSGALSGGQVGAVPIGPARSRPGAAWSRFGPQNVIIVSLWAPTYDHGGRPAQRGGHHQPAPGRHWAGPYRPGPPDRAKTFGGAFGAREVYRCQRVRCDKWWSAATNVADVIRCCQSVVGVGGPLRPPRLFFQDRVGPRPAPKTP